MHSASSPASINNMFIVMRRCQAAASVPHSWVNDLSTHFRNATITLPSAKHCQTINFQLSTKTKKQLNGLQLFRFVLPRDPPRHEICTYSSMAECVCGNFYGFIGLEFRVTVTFRQFSPRQIRTSADPHIRISAVSDIRCELYSSYKTSSHCCVVKLWQ